MLIDRKLVAVVIVAIAAGWWLGSSPASPINPTPQRPVLTAIGRLARTAARLGLWVAFAAEAPPQQRDDRIVQHAYDEAGHPIIDHGDW